MKNIAQRVEVPRGSSGRVARRTEASAPDGRTQFSLSFESPESLNSLSFARSTYAPLTICELDAVGASTWAHTLIFIHFYVPYLKSI